jgi:hypothetical protein
MILDPIFFLFLIPGMLLAGWAQARVRSAFNQYSQVGTMNNVTGAEAAAVMLDKAGIFDVRIVPVAGAMTDHYDPTTKRLALSEPVFDSPSIAAVGIACHEAGHAIQHHVGYPFLKLRSILVAVTSTGANIGMSMMAIGLMLSSGGGIGSIGRYVVGIGAALFSVLVFFQIVTLPVEFDATRRAKRLMLEHRIVYPEERRGADAVLNAAAWTYVAAVFSSLGQVLYFLFRAGLLGGGRRRESYDE